MERNDRRHRQAEQLACGLACLSVGLAVAFYARKSNRAPGAVAPRARHRVQVEQVTTVNRPIEDVYQFWRNFQNFPRFMQHLESVAVLGDRRSHWRAKGPAGMTVEWDAELLRGPGERVDRVAIARGSQIQNSGSVRFCAGARGARHRSARAARIRAAGRTARPRHRLALRRGAEPADPRRPASIQAAHGDRRDPACPTGWVSRASGAPGRRSETTQDARGSPVMKANCWHGHADRPGGGGSRSEDPQPARRHRPDHEHGDLRLGPASLQRLHPDDEARRRPGPRVHGRGRRARQRRQQPAKSAIASSCRFPIACGHCLQCERELYSLCENSNPNAWMAEKMWGYSPCGHLRLLAHARRLCRRAGRVRARAVCRCRPDQGAGRPRRTSRCCSSPTSSRPATWRAEVCDIQPGDTIAVWGCGPVGQFAIKSAYLLGAERVIAIDRFPYRLRMAREQRGRGDDQLRGGRRPRSAEGDDRRPRPGPLHRRRRHGRRMRPGIAGAYDRAKHAMMLETDRPIALRQAILACRSGGTVSVAGVYGGFIDKFPMGAVVNRSLTIKSGQTTCTATCGRCSNGSSRARSTRASSSRIGCG